MASPTDIPEFVYDLPEVAPARLRLRHYLLLLAFVVIVIIPTATAAWLSWNFAGTLRQVTASVAVQEHSLGSFGAEDAGSALQSAFKGSGAAETKIVRQLIRSEDFFRTIAGQIDLTEIWPHDRLVPYLPPRYDKDAVVERRHDFWRNMVVVHIGSRDEIIRISVTAFDQPSAERLLTVIRAEAERRINIARTATLQSALDHAIERVEVLRARYEADQKRLLDFRLEQKTIDPSVLAQLTSEYANALRSMKAEEEISIAEATASVSGGSELTRNARNRISAISRYIEDANAGRAGLVKPDEVTRLMAEYQPLLTEAEMSGAALRAAELSVIRFTQDLESTKAFLSSVTGGESASIRVFPQFLPALLITLICCFLIWAVILMTYYGIRDQK